MMSQNINSQISEAEILTRKMSSEFRVNTTKISEKASEKIVVGSVSDSNVSHHEEGPKEIDKNHLILSDQGDAKCYKPRLRKIPSKHTHGTQ